MKDFPKDKNVCFVSLGCDKNTVDAERLMFALKQDGFNLVEDVNKAHIIVVNTCAFIKPAQEESIEAILRAEKLKSKTCEKLIVTGCLAERNGEELQSEIPSVDKFVKLKDNINLSKIIFELYNENYCTKQLDCATLDRVVSTPSHYAYVKIAEGCNNFCSYCTIPFIRGRFKSRAFDDVVNECKQLVFGGVRELIFVAQDVTRYGSDLENKKSIVDLVNEVSKIPDLQWIRLHYCYPELITDELIKTIDDNPKVCKYIDIPLQHIDDTILKKMNRKGNYKNICTLLDKIKNCKNKISIRSSFIVGFPYETRKSQNLLKKFLKNYELDNVGFFIYSKEDGTASAKFSHQVPALLKKLRQKSLYKLQNKIAINNNKRKIGQTTLGVCEGYDPQNEIYIFRDEYNSPNVDTIIYAKSERELNVGEFYDLQIVDFDGLDLICYVLDEKEKKIK